MMMAPTAPTSGEQFLEVLEAIERLNVEAERLTQALSNARVYMTSQLEQRKDVPDEP